MWEGNHLQKEKKKLCMVLVVGADAKETALKRADRSKNATKGEAVETKLVLQQTVECNFEHD